MNQYGKDSHTTFLGAVTTMIVYPMLALLAIYMLFFFDRSSQTIIYTAMEINPIDSPNEGIKLDMDGEYKLDMIVLVNDEDFDNEDNPYGEFVLHMYTNMKNLLDTSVDVDEDT